MPIDAGERSAPCIVDWDANGRQDLLVGDKTGRITVYLDAAASGAPDLQSAFVLQAGDGDLLVPGGRACPTLADFDGDGAKDLVSGHSGGRVFFYPNRGSNAAPVFAAGAPVEVGSLPFDLGGELRSHPCVADWNGDGDPDLTVGSALGTVQVLLGRPGATVAPNPPWSRRLEPPWPNPFQPATTVVLSLRESESVLLTLHDAAGRLVVTLCRDRLAPGRHSFRWDGRDARDRDCPAGVYLLRLRASAGTEQRKLVLLR